MKGVGLFGLHSALRHGDIGAFMLRVVVNNCIKEFIIGLFNIYLQKRAWLSADNRKLKTLASVPDHSLHIPEIKTAIPILMNTSIFSDVTCLKIHLLTCLQSDNLLEGRISDLLDKKKTPLQAQPIAGNYFPIKSNLLAKQITLLSAWHWALSRCWN